MEWVAGLRGTVVGLDTAPLIYLIEENSIYFPFVLPFFEALDRGEFVAVTSIITLAEVLVVPMLPPRTSEPIPQDSSSCESPHYAAGFSGHCGGSGSVARQE